jgi:asparagine synthase (glutamine-hydrolysing)
VPLGAFLSGGVDSSTVVAMMAEAKGGTPVQSCAIGFDVAALDETGHARRVAALFGADHRERIVAADDFSQVDRLAALFDEPFADASALPMLRLCEMARERVTVALSGDGADEAFGGYRRQVFHAGEERLRAALPAGLRAPLFGTLGNAWPQSARLPRPLRARATLLALAGDGDAAYADAVGVTGRAARHALYSDHMMRELGGFAAEGEWIELMRTAPGRSGLDRAQYADLTFWLPGDILTKVDRTSMAVGLEAREPLLDHRLVAFAATLPETMRVRGREGKWLLKKTMERHLPHDILYRPKMGFVTPIANWLRGPLASETRGIAALARTGWFRADSLIRVADAHLSGRRDESRLIWQLIMLDKALARLFGM